MGRHFDISLPGWLYFSWPIVLHQSTSPLFGYASAYKYWYMGSSNSFSKYRVKRIIWFLLKKRTCWYNRATVNIMQVLHLHKYYLCLNINLQHQYKTLFTLYFKHQTFQATCLFELFTPNIMSNHSQKFSAIIIFL